MPKRNSGPRVWSPRRGRIATSILLTCIYKHLAHLPDRMHMQAPPVARTIQIALGRESPQFVAAAVVTGGVLQMQYRHRFQQPQDCAPATPPRPQDLLIDHRVAPPPASCGDGSFVHLCDVESKQLLADLGSGGRSGASEYMAPDPASRPMLSINLGFLCEPCVAQLGRE